MRCRCILRKKNYRTPSVVYGDEDELVDPDKMYIYKNSWEMFLQVLDRPGLEAAHFRGAETSVFTRRWRPSTLTLEEMVDTPLATLNRAALAAALATEDLPGQRIEIARAAGTFPCDGSLLAVQEELSWTPLLDEQDEEGRSSDFRYPCNIQTDGEMIYWREKGEQLKPMTEAERRDLARRDLNGVDMASSTAPSTSYSPRKERPLRILLDSPCVSRTDPPESVHQADAD